MSQQAPIRITIVELQSWTELPPKLAAALEQALTPAPGAVAVASPGPTQVPHKALPAPEPEPPQPEQAMPAEAAPAKPEVPKPEVPKDVQWVLGQLLEDQATRMVTEVLIVPLFEAFPNTQGEVTKVLRQTATTFKSYARTRLDFARKHLLHGNHKFFPDAEEIRAAIGRYDGRRPQPKLPAK